MAKRKMAPSLIEVETCGGTSKKTVRRQQIFSEYLHVLVPFKVVGLDQEKGSFYFQGTNFLVRGYRLETSILIKG